MKVRFGFVSNSSSTSFCLYGANVPTEVVANFLKSKGIEIPEEKNNARGVAEILSKYFDDNNINLMSDTYYPDYWTGVNIGRDPFSMEPNETWQQFKESVEKVLKTIDNNIVARPMVEGWFAG